MPAHRCTENGCPLPGRYMPRLFLRAKCAPGPATQITLNELSFCQHHRDLMTFAQVVPADSPRWSSIRESFRRLGRAVPEHDKTQMTWEKCL